MMEMRSHGSTSNSSSSTGTQIQLPETISRSDPNSTHPTTYVTADTSSFKKVVQDLTSNHCPTGAAAVLLPPRNSAIPAIKTSVNKKKGFKLHERRNRVLMISPLAAGRGMPEMVSPSTLDFPSLTLISPATSFSAAEDEEKAIADKGFYLHPSPRESDPTLLPLFPVTSPADNPGNLVE